MFRVDPLGFMSSWPLLREDLAQEESVTIAVQVNGKLRGTVEATLDVDQETVQTAALALEGVYKFTNGKSVKRVIFVPNKLLNIVVV